MNISFMSYLLSIFVCSLRLFGEEAVFTGCKYSVSVVMLWQRAAIDPWHTTQSPFLPASILRKHGPRMKWEPAREERRV